MEPSLRRSVPSRSVATTFGRTPVEPLGIDGGELAAGAVDVAASRVAHGGWYALGDEPAHEFALVLGARRRPLGARRRVERDQVDVDPAPVAVRLEDVAE